MTPRDLLERNGDSRSSPLLDTARRLHAFFVAAGIPYVIIGGLAVVRNGAFRTTHDIDILLSREDWEKARPLLEGRFRIQLDHAEDLENGVPVDVLYSGDDWDMVLPLPRAAEVAEFDPELGANFLGLGALLQLKTAVYLAKRRDEGIELAAKDLSDVVELLRHNPHRVTPALLAKMHPLIREELSRLLSKVRKRK